MSYPGPPGASSGSSHPSLPPRPPTTTAPSSHRGGSSTGSRFSSTFISAAPPSYAGAGPHSHPSTHSYAGAPSYPSGAPGYAAHYGAAPTAEPSYPSYPSYSQAPVGGGGGGGRGAPSYNNYSQSYNQRGAGGRGAGGYYGAQSGAYSTPPQIQNPFPAPGGAAADAYDRDGYNPDEAAQIAQWHSAYMPRDPNEAAETGRPGEQGRGTAAGGAIGPVAPGAAAAAAGAAAAATGMTNVDGTPAERQHTVYREGGGKKWADDSLLEWDPSHPRLFVGNLAGETTDESLLKAFARWASVVKAKVVRDKRTNKSRGFGFVSFSDPDDYFQAAREMNGKYIQSHPVVVKKANTEIKVANVRDDGRGGGKGGKNNKGYRNKHKGGSGGGGGGQYEGGYEPQLGPAGGGGVQKAGQKTRGGLKILG